MAVNQKDVLNRVQALDGSKLISVSKEVQNLHEVLHDGENIQAVACGLIANKNWLATLTDQRVLLTYFGFASGQQTVEEIPLDKLISVSCKRGMLSSDLTIEWAGGRKELSSVPKDLADDMANHAYRLLKTTSAQPASASAANDTISALERLAALHEKGLLTAEEFTAQKTALLGQTSTPEADPQPTATPQSDPTPTEAVQQAVAPPKKFLTWKKALAFVAILFIGLAIIGGESEEKIKQRKEQEAQAEAAMTPEQKLARYLDNVKKVDSTITEVQLWDTGNGTRTLGVFYTKDIALKVFYTMGMNCESISKKLVQKNLIDDNITVLYFVHVPTVDKLGNKGTGLAMKIAWAGATLRKINWDNMFPPQFMNLCESVEMRPLLYTDFREFVQDKDNVTEFTAFIRTVLASNKNL